MCHYIKDINTLAVPNTRTLLKELLALFRRQVTSSIITVDKSSNYCPPSISSSIVAISHSLNPRAEKNCPRDDDARLRGKLLRFRRRKVHFWGTNFCTSRDAERHYDKSHLSSFLPKQGCAFLYLTCKTRIAVDPWFSVQCSLGPYALYFSR